MRIALDAMGGDNAPYEIVWGGVVAAAQSQDSVILVGDEGAIRKALRHRHPKIRPIPDVEALLANGRLSILHTDESIAMDDAPAAAVRRKKNCSINVCMRLVKEGKADAAVSAGNSGAMAASALFVLGRIKGVARPAIATVLPSKDPDRPTLLLDAGANTDCHHEWLREFAVMGDIYSRLVLGREKPVVGLMSIGTEDSKGNELTKHAFPLLRDYTPGGQDRRHRLRRLHRQRHPQDLRKRRPRHRLLAQADRLRQLPLQARRRPVAAGPQAPQAPHGPRGLRRRAPPRRLRRGHHHARLLHAQGHRLCLRRRVARRRAQRLQGNRRAHRRLAGTPDG